MKKIAFLLFLSYTFTLTTANAQEFTYGTIIGANAYVLNFNDEELFSRSDSYSAFGKDGFPLNIGFYGNYQLSESLGVKANLFYKGNYRRLHFLLADRFNQEEFNRYVPSIQFQPLLAFDVNKEYGKGFYLVVGPGIDFELYENKQNSNIYKNVIVDALFGFGFTFSEFIGMEFIGNYGITNHFVIDYFKSSTFGAYVSLYFNVASLIDK